jgi:Flp pilus assembly protein TadB
MIGPTDRLTLGVTSAAVLHSWAVIALTPAWTLQTHAVIAAASGIAALVSHRGIRRLRRHRHRRRWAAALPETLLTLGSLLRAHRVPEHAVRTIAETAPQSLIHTFARVERAPECRGEPVMRALQQAFDGLVWTRSVCVELAAGVDRDDAAAFDRVERRILTAQRERLRAAADRLQTQLTALFLLGVFAPLVAVGLLPAAGAGGLAIDPPVVAVVYHLWVPLALGAGVTLLALGPIADLQPVAALEIPTRGLTRALLGGGATALAVALVGGRVVPWAAIHLGAASGVAVLGHVLTGPHIAACSTRAAIRGAIPDLMASLGAQLTDGRAPECAIAAAGDETPLGQVCTRVDTHLRAGASLPAALEEGLSVAPAVPRLQRWAVHYRVAATLGTAGGPLCASVGHAWHAADTVRSEARHQLRGLARMCTHTGAIIGPIIAGTTVAMLGALTETTLTGRPLAPQAAGPPVASTVFAIGLLLPSVGVLLDHGPVGPLIARQAAHAVLLAMLVFTLTVHLVGQLI